MTNLKIVFMGTPDFARHILEHLVTNNCQVVGCVTAPDKPAGRGRKIQASAVKLYAESCGIPVFQPEKLRDEQFLQQIKSLNADVFVVVAFRMLPKVLWSMPQKGTFNLHASLLPDYRGAAPINWAIINGETQTGVTTFFIDDKIDTGAVLLQEKTQITEQETAQTLHDKLMKQGAELVLKTLQQIENDEVKPKVQPEKSEKDAFKIFKETCRIDWQKSVKELDCFVRGLSPYPTAWAILKQNSQELSVKIYQVKPIFEKHQLPIGKIICENKQLKVAVSDGFLEIISLQMPSKKQMTTQELLNGFSFAADAMFV